MPVPTKFLTWAQKPIESATYNATKVAHMWDLLRRAEQGAIALLVGMALVVIPALIATAFT